MHATLSNRRPGFHDAAAAATSAGWRRFGQQVGPAVRLGQQAGAAAAAAAGYWRKPTGLCTERRGVRGAVNKGQQEQ